MSTQTKNPYNEQIMRLSSLQKFPIHPQGIAELRDALRKNSGTPEKAMLAIDKVIGEREVCPTPRELAVIAQEIIRQTEAVPLGCPICQGGQWVSVQRLVKGPDGIERVLDRAMRCDCTKGQYLASKDRENQSKREMGLLV